MPRLEQCMKLVRGIRIAESQESSNVTYCVYDYKRIDKNGKNKSYILVRLYWLWIWF